MPNITIDLSNLNIPLSVWQSRVLLVVGPPCVGKQALVRELCARRRKLKPLHTITTRQRRLSDSNDEMTFVVNDEFAQRSGLGEFFYTNIRNNGFYAYSKIELNERLYQGHSVILIFHSRGAIELKKHIWNIPTIFMVSDIDLLIERCANRHDPGYKVSSEELSWSIQRNQESYDIFKDKESNCIQLDNSADEPPIAKMVINEAFSFVENTIL